LALIKAKEHIVINLDHRELLMSDCEREVGEYLYSK